MEIRKPTTDDDLAVLTKAINSGEVTGEILGSYDGGLSLGISQDGGEYVFRLRVEGDDIEQFPDVVEVAEGDTRYNVRVIVEGNFEQPVAISA